MGGPSQALLLAELNLFIIQAKLTLVIPPKGDQATIPGLYKGVTTLVGSSHENRELMTNIK